MKLEKLVSILRYRKCKEILFHSHALTDTCVQTQLPSVIISVLDFFIPLLQNFNELTMICKYSRILMDYSRRSNNTRGKLRACEFYGYYLKMNNKYEEALKRFFKMLEYSLRINEKELEIKAYGNIGMCYYYLGEIQKVSPSKKDL